MALLSNCDSRWHLAVLLAALSGCGGGGGGGGSSTDASPAGSNAGAVTNSTRPVEQSDSQIAQILYSGAPRTSPGFHSESTPAGYGQVATTHLKNADIDAAAVAPQPLYELCTDDWNQALAWSESFAQQGPQYADLVETSDELRYFEFGRVRQSEPSLYRRARVFKCAYLDRASANLRSASGSAGQLNLRPLGAAELGTLAEYLWQFTLYNNFGHAVLRSSGTSSNGQLTHTLHMASLVRAGVSSSCDRIDVIAWRHTLDAASGALQLDTTTLWSFGARESAGVASLCSG